jgi:hypothetical protein
MLDLKLKIIERTIMCSNQLNILLENSDFTKNGNAKAHNKIGFEKKNNIEFSQCFLPFSQRIRYDVS